MVGRSHFNHRKQKVSKISAGGRLRKKNEALMSGALISATLISVILIPNSGFSPDILETNKTIAFLHLKEFNAHYIVSKEIASHNCRSVLFMIFKFSYEINLLHLDDKVFFCVYRVNFPHFEILPPLCVNFLYWGVICPSIRVNFK